MKTILVGERLARDVDAIWVGCRDEPVGECLSHLLAWICLERWVLGTFWESDGFVSNFRGL